VYDPAADTVYLTTKIVDGPASGHRTGTCTRPAARRHRARPGAGTLQGTADYDPSVTFDLCVEHQQAGLLLANGVVCIGFGSHRDVGA
jgi:hypothetical protein